MTPEEAIQRTTSYLVSVLDGIEKRPKMFGGPEGIEMQYMLALDVLAELKGLDPNVVRMVYDEHLRRGVGQTNMPFYGHNKTAEEVAEFMSKVRKDLNWF